MKRLLRCIGIDLKYMVISPRFFFACTGYAAISLLSVMEEMQAIPGASVYYLHMVYSFYPFWLLFLLFAVVPGSASFCSDWENRFFRYAVQRAGKVVYACSKAVSCFLASFLLVFLAQGLFLFLLRLRGPMYLDMQGEGMAGTVFYSLMNETDIWKYFFIRIMTISVGGGFFSVFALWFSTKLTNIFVVLFSPMILYFLIENLTIWLKLPIFLSLPRILNGTVTLSSGPWQTLGYAITVFTVLAAIFAIAFCRSCKRRVENG